MLPMMPPNDSLRKNHQLFSSRNLHHSPRMVQALGQVLEMQRKEGCHLQGQPHSNRKDTRLVQSHTWDPESSQNKEQLSLPWPQERQTRLSREGLR